MSRRALVTGASRGIGRATCRALADAGWQVVAGVRDLESGVETFASQDAVKVVHLDVTDRATIDAAVAEVEAEGPLDCLVNNAGYAMFAATEEADLDEARAMFDTNFFGALATTQAAMPLLRASKGVVVNVSSIGARASTPFVGLYLATKGAMRSASESLAIEVAPHGVRVVMIEPGMVATEFPLATKRSGPATEGEGPYAESVVDLIAAFGRWRERNNTTPETVAAAIVDALGQSPPPFMVPVGEDADQLASLRSSSTDREMLEHAISFLGLDIQLP